MKYLKNDIYIYVYFFSKMALGLGQVEVLYLPLSFFLFFLNFNKIILTNDFKKPKYIYKDK